MAQSINNPEIPHISAINDGLFPGKMLRIQGATPPTSQRFNINLQCGPNVSPRDDIALHLSVRLAEGCIGRNSLMKQMWGEEQNQGPNIITAGQPFELLILADHRDYKIAINGKHFCEFFHRIPLTQVSYLTIDGDVSIKSIIYEITAPPPNAAPMPMGSAPPMQNYQNQPPMGPYNQPPYGGPAGSYGPYGPPPPPGHNPDADKSSGLEGFLGQAGAAIVGAFGNAVIQGALSGKQGQQNSSPAQPTPPPPPPQQQQPFAGGYGGQSVGGLGSIGSFLTNTLADTLLKPSKKKKHKKEMKAAKKAMKYGLPALGIGFGAYKLHKGFKHHGHYGHHYRRSSSSSSSSDSS